MPGVERIGVGDDVFAYVVRAGDPPTETAFVSPNEANLQVGFIVKRPGDTVPRHDHHPVERTIVGTAEVLVVRQGGGRWRCTTQTGSSWPRQRSRPAT